MRFQRPNDEVPEINLVPMMDVLMTVLTFFILVSMTLTGSTGGSVQLPRAKMAVPVTAPSPGDLPRNPLVLAIDGKKSLTLNNQAVDRANLEKQIVDYLSANPDGIVLVQADRSLPYREVLVLLEDLQALGGDRVLLAYEEGSKK